MKIKILALLIIIIALIVTHFYLDGTSEIITESFHANKAVSLANGRVLTQVLNTGDLSIIKEVQIQFGTYKRVNTGILSIALYENDKEIAHMKYPTEELIDNAFQSFKWEEPVEINKSNQYVVKISEEYNGKNTVAVWTNDSTNGNYEIDNTTKPGTICYKLIGK